MAPYPPSHPHPFPSLYPSPTPSFPAIPLVPQPFPASNPPFRANPFPASNPLLPPIRAATKVDVIVGRVLPSLRHRWGYECSFDAKRPQSGGFVGLKNQGCTCYMNSTLQQVGLSSLMAVLLGGGGGMMLVVSGSGVGVYCGTAATLSGRIVPCLRFCSHGNATSVLQ